MYKERLDSITFKSEDDEIIITFQIRNHCIRKPYMFQGHIKLSMSNQRALNMYSKFEKQEGFNRYIEMLNGERVLELVHNVSTAIGNEITNSFGDIISVDMNELSQFMQYNYKNIILNEIRKFDSTIAIDAI